MNSLLIGGGLLKGRLTMISYHRGRCFLIAAAAIATTPFLSPAANAAIVACTITSNQTTTYIVGNALASPGGEAGLCFDGGSGNINGGRNDGFLADHADEGYMTLAKLSPGATSPFFQVTGNGGHIGTWSVSSLILNAFDDLAIGLKAGNSWAVVLLQDGASSGVWASSRALSHAVLYGTPASPPPTTAVPGPIAGAGLPALLALGGFVWARRRKPAAA